MSQPILKHASAATPIERIFEKVVRRKMNAKEREALHLNTPAERHVGISGSRSTVAHKMPEKLAS
jgi:hypothetical protein